MPPVEPATRELDAAPEPDEKQEQKIGSIDFLTDPIAKKSFSRVCSRTIRLAQEATSQDTAAHPPELDGDSDGQNHGRVSQLANSLSSSQP